MQNQTTLIAVVVLFIVGAVAFLLWQGNNLQLQNNLQGPAATVAPVGGGPEITGVQNVSTITLTAKPFEFSMPEIVVNQGDRVRVIFTSTEGMHDFVIDEFNVKTPQLQAGQSATVEFTADKAGTFNYYCSVNDHRQRGMEGKLIVQES